MALGYQCQTPNRSSRLKAISLDSVIAITGKSRRTWWRRISEGDINRAPDDEKGRAMLSWSDVAPHVCIPMTAEEQDIVLRADTNDADAQNDIGLIFLSASKHEEAIYWLKRSAQQENPDAMQGLGSCYLSGIGVPKDDYLGIMWISKAASYGHMIAKAQMAALWPGYVAIQK